MKILQPDRLLAVRDLPALLAFLRDELDWPIEGDQIEELTFDWSGEELGLGEAEAPPDRIQQLQPLVAGQPWGIFLLEFGDRRMPVALLRRMLRALVRKRRTSARAADRPAWELEDLLFICRHREDEGDFTTFVHFAQPPAEGRAARLTSFGWTADSAVRTLLEYNLPALRWPDDPSDADAWRAQWRSAFDVEAVTKRFFDDYKRVFADLQTRLAKTTDDKAWAHDYALQLLNRLMFLYFLRRKGWLGNNRRFMANFWRAYQAAGQTPDTFYDRWLSILFFEAFNNKFHGGHRHFQGDSFRAADGPLSQRRLVPAQ